jgi:oligopeptide/dipeptide ABC transporter ATP-binding protein
VSLLEVRDLSKRFETPAGVVHAVNGVSFTLDAGQSLAIVGESGSGKSTVARCVVRLLEPSSGQILFDGAEITRLDRRAFRRYRAQIQIVFQDPSDSLNPRLKVGSQVEEPLLFFTRLSRAERRRRVCELFHQVQLDAALTERYPRQLSGGQQQRVAIARAIATSPRLVVLDEPTSALDVSIRAEILQLLSKLQRELRLTYLLISHDLSALEVMGGDLAVMYLGRIVERASIRRIFQAPAHPYTCGLLLSRLVPDPHTAAPTVGLIGEPPSAVRLPVGCALAGRCSEADAGCVIKPPRLLQLEQAPESHLVACFHRTCRE